MLPEESSESAVLWGFDVDRRKGQKNERRYRKTVLYEEQMWNERELMMVNWHFGACMRAMVRWYEGDESTEAK